MAEQLIIYHALIVSKHHVLHIVYTPKYSLIFIMMEFILFVKQSGLIFVEYHRILLKMEYYIYPKKYAYLSLTIIFTLC